MQTTTFDSDALAARVNGPVLRAPDSYSDAGGASHSDSYPASYDAERAGAQTFGRHRPEVIVGATTADDVREAVAFAAAHQLPVAVQATGHGIPLPADGGLLINTSRMTEVRVDPESRTARVAAGTRWEEVVAAAGRAGLTPLSGSAPTTGAVAYTLGGGIGLLSRTYGFAADHVRAVDVVTADGTPRHVTASERPDLFWALRGGRANFGVATSIEFDLMPVERIYGGSLFFDAELATDVLAAYQRFAAQAPEAMNSSLALLPFPVLDGKPVVHVRIAHVGDTARGQRLVEPLRAVGPRLLDTLADMPYTESATIHNEPREPMGYYASNVLMRTLDLPAVREVFNRAGPAAADPCIVEIRHLGGAMGRAPAVPNAVGNRNACYTVGVLSKLDSDAEASVVDAIRARQQGLLDILRPQATSGGVLNFMYGENATTEDVRTAYEPADYQRLTELKAGYDPANLFRHNHNIPPAIPKATG